ncbi:MAG TPA: Ig-like domain-containing protein [Actinomycetota bacterium]
MRTSPRFHAGIVGVIILGVMIAAVSCGIGGRQDGGEDCTTELGIHIEPRQVTIEVAEQVRVSVETSTCGGRFRGRPAGLTLRSQDPGIASVDNAGRVIGVSLGRTEIDVRSSIFSRLGVVMVIVVPG